MCIDVEIWLEIANGQFFSIFDRVICPLYGMMEYYCSHFYASPQKVATYYVILSEILSVHPLALPSFVSAP